MTEVLDQEYWSVDGTALHRLGWSVATLPGIDLPQLRGDDAITAVKPGRQYVEKVPEARTISLQMWVTGSDPATGIGSSNPRVKLNDNWRTLTRLFRPSGSGRITLTRRRLYGATSPALSTTTALAECVAITPSMTGRGRMEFSVDLSLATPYFFGSTVTTSSLPIGATTVNNPGDETASWFEMEVDLVGPLVNPVLLAQATGFGSWVKYNGTITAGQTVTLDVGEFTALRGTTNVVDKVAHGGKPYWFGLYRGDNTVTLSADSGAGHAVIRYKPPYW